MTSPTRFVDDSTVTTRKGEIPSADFDGGLNQGAACAPAVGINVGVANIAGSDNQFTLLDQDEAARTPQVGQHIGGDGLGDGVSGKGTEGVGVVTNDASGDGTVTEDGEATLVSLAAGWSAV